MKLLLVAVALATQLSLPVAHLAFASQWDRYTGFFPVPLAYKLIYYGNGINILRSHYNKFHIAKRPF